MTVSGATIPPTEDQDLGQAAEALGHQSLSYGQLVRRRFMSNTYGVAGLFLCVFVVFTAIFAGFLAPYSTTNTDSTALYAPPQWIKIFDENGSLSRPFVYGVTEEMDPNTFEITFVRNTEDKIPIEFFVAGDPWHFLGIPFTVHLFGGADGKRVGLLGTDNLGRDVFSRMIWGSRVTLLMGFLVMVAACVIGTIIGVSAGYFGGTFDLISQRVVEFVKAFPDLPLYLALVALLPRRADPEFIFLMFAGILVLLRWADLARELRGKVFALRRLDYIRAAEAVGARSSRILGRHILPNVMSHVVVWATFALPEIILLESFLSFLGVGVQAPMVSWGSMLNQILDFQSFSAAPWMMSPVMMIIISVLAFNAFGDGLRDAIDPYSDA